MGGITRLRGFDGSNIIEFNCQPANATTSALRVTLPDGTLRGISLVPASEATSKFRVRLSNTIMALSSAIIINTCEELQLIGYHPAYPLNETYQLGQDIHCEATNPANSSFANRLWQVGYAVWYGGKGKNGKTDVLGDPGYDDALPALEGLGSKGFKPIGYSTGVYYLPPTNPFTGKLDGRGCTITGLTIDRAGENYVGLFGATYNSTITNVGLVGGSVSGFHHTGGLVGWSSGRYSTPLGQSNTITNSYSTVTVTGHENTGGLVGHSEDTTISHCYFAGNVTGWSYPSGGGTITGGFTGGLVGEGGFGTITDSHSSGTITGVYGGGGLVGFANKATISKSYSTAAVASEYTAGGLVGINGGWSTITDCYASGVVTGSYSPGGLVGDNTDGTIVNSYASGTVTASGTYSPTGSYSGGLVGSGHFSNITNSFSTGAATITGFPVTTEAIVGPSFGGLIGQHIVGIIREVVVGTELTNNWWYNDTNTQSVGNNATISGVTKAALKDDFYGTGAEAGKAVYTGTPAWDFTNTWTAVPGALPHLKCPEGQTWDSTAGACH